MIDRPGRLVLLGHPVSHSLSPRFQNAALRAAGIRLEYEALDVAPAELPRTLAALAAVGGAGNVTIPHKEAVARACGRLTTVAERAGAVNTFWHEGGVLAGDNTDVEGFERAVVALLGELPRNLTVGVHGAGGAARAVLAAVERWPGAQALVFNRTPERAAALCARFSSIAQLSDSTRLAREAKLLVNATSIGLRDDAMPVAPESVRADAAALDLVYRPGETAWVRALRAAGHRAADGLGMLLEQGALAFERWFALSPDREAMRRAVQGPG